MKGQHLKVTDKMLPFSDPLELRYFENIIVGAYNVVKLQNVKLERK